MILCMIFSILGSYFIWLCWLADKWNKSFAIGGTVIYWVIFLFVCLIIRICHEATVKGMRIFYEVDKENIIHVINETKQLAKNINSTEYELEKLSLSQSVSERLKELAERIEIYNSMLAEYHVFRENPFTSWFVPKLDGLDYIKIAKEKNNG